MNHKEEIIALKEELATLRKTIADRDIDDHYRDMNMEMLLIGIHRVQMTQWAQYELGNFEELRLQKAFDWHNQHKVKEQQKRNSKPPEILPGETVEQFLKRTVRDT